jgi:GH24 family phage-related lysozyme (muramidase)
MISLIPDAKARAAQSMERAAGHPCRAVLGAGSGCPAVRLMHSREARSPCCRSFQLLVRCWRGSLHSRGCAMATNNKPVNRKATALALAVAIAVPAEGLRQAAYRDVTGLPTVCFGSTQGVKMGDFRTVPECKALLTKEMSHVIETVDRCRPGLPPEVLAAFSDTALQRRTQSCLRRTPQHSGQNACHRRLRRSLQPAAPMEPSYCCRSFG